MTSSALRRRASSARTFAGRSRHRQGVHARPEPSSGSRGPSVSAFMGNLECPQHALGEQLMRRKAGNVLTIKADGASAWLVETGDDIEKRGLAGAVWSISPVIDPASIVSETSLTALMPPKFLDKCSTAIMRHQTADKQNGPDVISGPSVGGLAVADGGVLTTLDQDLGIASSRFTRADQLNSRSADIVDITATGDDLQRLAELARVDLFTRCVGDPSPTFSL